MKLNAKQNFVIFTRYVNVSAVVCLLILVEILAPQSSAAAAPLITSNEQKDPMWANPCSYDEINKTPQAYSSKFAKNVAVAAKIALDNATSYKNEFAHKFLDWSFELLNSTCRGDTKITLLQEKAHNLKVIIEEILPTMYNTLNAVSKEMHSIAEDQSLFSNQNTIIIDGKSLSEKINETAKNIQSVLCEFNDLMRTDKFKEVTLNSELKSEVESLLSSEDTPIVPKSVKVAKFYLATLNYLEYVEQVFNKIEDLL